MGSENKIAVAMTADTTMDAGVHVTAYTLMQSLQQSWSCDLFFFAFGYGQKIQQSLEQTLSPFEGRVHVKVTHLEEDKVKGAKSFHGSFVPYVIFHIPHLLDVDRVIFLDCDLIVTCDLSTLWQADLGGKAVGAVPVGKVGQTGPKSRKFMAEGGLPDSAPVYNSGVLMIDIEKWERKNYTKRMVGAANGAPSDQEVINLVADIAPLDAKYNVLCGPVDRTGKLLKKSIEGIMNQDKIFHFYGSPKPWEPFAQYLHPYGAYFELILNRYDICYDQNKISVKKLRRLFLLSRSYVKLFADSIRRLRSS